MTLKIRFFTVFAGFILLVLAIYSVTYYLIEQRAQLLEQRQNARGSMEKVVSACREAYLSADWIAAVNHIKVVQRDPAVVFTDCLDLNGRERAHSEANRIGLFVQPPPSPPPAGAFDEKEYLSPKGRRTWEISSAITLGARVMGVARIGYDLAYLEERTQVRLLGTLQRMALVSTITLFLAILASLLVAASLVRPIRELVHATEEVKEGHLDYQSQVVARSDELGQLARSFNEMSHHLAELDEMKQQFVDSITHDLKSPLTVVRGYLEMILKLQAASLSEKLVRHLRIIDAASQRLQQYVSNILDFSKLKVGKLPMTLKTFSLVDIANSVIEGFALPSELAGIRVEGRIQEGLPPVSADYEMIHRVISNLVTNALKFTPKGGRITIHVDRQDGVFLHVAVQDTGMGIPVEDLPRVFERFYQVQKTRALAKASGAGLGLTISKRIVEQHGGRIWVESKMGVGTTFHFNLPAAQVPVPAVNVLPKDASGRAG